MRKTSIAVLFLLSLGACASRAAAPLSTEDSLRHELVAHATPLHGAGETLLLQEAERNQYFLLGELHGEVEIPALLSDMWPALWNAGYRHVAAEVSPWAAYHLEQSIANDPTPIEGLWTRQQAAVVRQFASSAQPVLWGCDMEEMRPDLLIKQMAQLNPDNDSLHRMADVVSNGYSRKQAPELLHMAESAHPAHDVQVGGESLWKSTLHTLRIETFRSDPHTRFAASDAREKMMKELFLKHLQQEPQGKVLLRFGRNHLHRGYDARGISTLGNFVAEWALAHGQSVLNVGVFAAGGKEHLAGQTFDADERQDEPTFALLATLAGKEPTLFDLRPLRSVLHSIPMEKRTVLEGNLIYWADSYDFLLCYPTVSPLQDGTETP